MTPPTDHPTHGTTRDNEATEADVEHQVVDITRRREDLMRIGGEFDRAIASWG